MPTGRGWWHWPGPRSWVPPRTRSPGVRLGDLYAFANAVASITDGAASIVDPLGRVLGYSTLPGQPIDELRRVTTLALQESKPPAFDADFKAVYAASGALYIPSTDEGVGRLALAVRAGGELLGSIWIIDPGAGKAPAAVEALDRMAPLAGLHMLHARSASDFGERRNGDLIRTLIDDPAHASFAAAQLGLDVTRGLAVAALTIARPESGSLDSVREIQRLLHLVTTVSNVQFKTSHSALIGSVIYAVFPCPGNDARALHRRVVQEIGAYSHTISSHPLIATVGGIARRVEDLPESRTEALQALEYLLNREAVAGNAGSAGGRAVPAVALYEDHRIPLNLMKVGRFIAEAGAWHGRRHRGNPGLRRGAPDGLHGHACGPTWSPTETSRPWRRTCMSTTTRSATGLRRWPRPSAWNSTIRKSASGCGCA